MYNVRYRIEVKPVDQSLEYLNSEVIYFLRCVGFWMLKKVFLSHGRRLIQFRQHETAKQFSNSTVWN